jgi:hypothetical protein
MAYSRVAFGLLFATCANSISGGVSAWCQEATVGRALSLLSSSTAHNELGLSDGQRAEWRVLADSLRADEQTLLLEHGGRGFEEFRSRLVIGGRRAEEKLLRVMSAKLNTDQLRRFRQIWTQVKGPEALLEPDRAKELKLTEAQRKGILSVMVPTVTVESNRSPFLETDANGSESKAKLLEAALSVLDPEQKRMWRSTVGPPFAFRPASGDMPTTKPRPSPVPPVPSRSLPGPGGLQGLKGQVLKDGLKGAEGLKGQG